MVDKMTKEERENDFMGKLEITINGENFVEHDYIDIDGNYVMIEHITLNGFLYDEAYIRSKPGFSITMRYLKFIQCDVNIVKEK